MDVFTWSFEQDSDLATVKMFQYPKEKLFLRHMGLLSPPTTHTPMPFLPELRELHIVKETPTSVVEPQQADALGLVLAAVVEWSSPPSGDHLLVKADTWVPNRMPAREGACSLRCPSLLLAKSLSLWWIICPFLGWSPDVGAPPVTAWWGQTLPVFQACGHKDSALPPGSVSPCLVPDLGFLFSPPASTLLVPASRTLILPDLPDLPSGGHPVLSLGHPPEVTPDVPHDLAVQFLAPRVGLESPSSMVGSELFSFPIDSELPPFPVGSEFPFFLVGSEFPATTIGSEFPSFLVGSGLEFRASLLGLQRCASQGGFECPAPQIGFKYPAPMVGLEFPAFPLGPVYLGPSVGFQFTFVPEL